MTETKKQATTFANQISILESRGVIVNDHDKAEEILSDIGYYRLGFYFFPFEKTYPFLDNRRKHEVIENTKFEDAVALYYYDFDLRNIINKYLSRIEVAIRTTMIYELSNKYNSNPIWFATLLLYRSHLSKIFQKKFIRKYLKRMSSNVIKRNIHATSMLQRGKQWSLWHLVI